LRRPATGGDRHTSYGGSVAEVSARAGKVSQALDVAFRGVRHPPYVGREVLRRRTASPLPTAHPMTRAPWWPA